MIADSVSDQGIRLSTLQLRYPKCIHGEFMTHRVFSRNASSSRAIPVERLIKDVIDDPYVPVHWGKNQKGMQADEECNEEVNISGSSYMVGKYSREQAWLYARDRAVSIAEDFAEASYHKQIINRLLEPFCHINVVVTATEWRNFFALRIHPDAQPEMQELARAIKYAIVESTPKLLKPGEWHLPYFNNEFSIRNDECQRQSIQVSVARCARVSYLTQEGKTPTVEKDLALYDRLVARVPLHASPCEHQGTPDGIRINGMWNRPELHGNFKGWIQYRKTLPGECQ